MRSNDGSGDETAAGGPLSVLENAIRQGRLAHGILMHGPSLVALEEACQRLAGQLLGAKPPLDIRAGYFVVRPRGKARMITIGTDSERVGGEWPVGTIRWLRSQVNLSSASGRKVAVVVEADRMNVAASNALLKTLEEPPEGTTLFLLTTRPHDLLPTIRSRCHNFRLPSSAAGVGHPAWQAWLEDYRGLLARLREGMRGKDGASAAVMTIYGLIARFDVVLQELAGAQWRSVEGTLPEEMPDEERDALQAGSYKNLRQQLLAEIEEATRDFALAGGAEGTARNALALGAATADLERMAGLLEVNFDDSAALEVFLLKSLRTWSAAGK